MEMLTGNPTQDINTLVKIQNEAHHATEKEEGEVIAEVAEKLILEKRKELLSVFKQLQHKKDGAKAHLARYPNIVDNATSNTLRNEVVKKAIHLVTPRRYSTGEDFVILSGPGECRGILSQYNSSLILDFSPDNSPYKLIEYGEHVAAQVSSTYPKVQAHSQQRAGDPICDYYKLALPTKGDRSVIVIADGCGWGKT